MSDEVLPRGQIRTGLGEKRLLPLGRSATTNLAQLLGAGPGKQVLLQARTSHRGKVMLSAGQARRAVPRAKYSPTPRTTSFRAEELWEGVVTAVGRRTFEATMLDRLGSEGRRTAQLDLALLAASDQRTLAQGDTFFYAVGWESRDGRTSYAATVRLRPLPAWTPEEIFELEMWAKDLDDVFE